MTRRLVIFDDDGRQAAGLLAKVDLLPRRDELEVTTVSDLMSLAALLGAGIVDILLMDIRIEGSTMDGIEFVRRHTGVQSGVQVIFVTGFDTYHSSAYRARHMGFLVKPVRQDQLEEAVGAALANLDADTERPFMVRTATGERAVSPRRLRYAESRLRKVILHVGDDEVETYGKLSDLIAQLPERFVPCHKSFVVNMGFIEELGKTELTLTTGERLPVSQRRRAEVREAFFDFVGRELGDGGLGA